MFRIDTSRVPAGEDENSIQIFKDGGPSLIQNCTGAPQAIPDPCVSGRELLGDGNIQLTILTSSASVWNFGVAQAPPGGPNKCLAGKTKCVNKKTEGLLKCIGKCQKNPAKCGSVQTACEAKVIAKFDGGTKGIASGCIGKLEIKNDGPCLTFGDTVSLEAKIDAFVADAKAELENATAPTPTPTPTPTVTATPTQVVTEIIDSTGDGTGNPLSLPEDIAVDGSGNVYVAGNSSDNAFKITPGGVITEIIDSTGDGAGNSLNNPTNIAVDVSGKVYVAGLLSHNAFRISNP